jgi:hypothetical protein
MARSIFQPLKPLPDDTNEMKTTIDVLNRAFVTYERKTKWQLKIGNLSYYPNKRKIYRDGDDRALPERGLESLMRLIAEMQQMAQHIQKIGKPEILDLSYLSAQEAPLPPAGLTMEQRRKYYGVGSS